MKRRIYGAYDSMGEMVNDHYRILLVMSRFGMGLGFGDKTIGEVCDENGVDVGTFLMVANMTIDGDGRSERENACRNGSGIGCDFRDRCQCGGSREWDGSKINPGALLDYLTGAHEYYLKYRFPAIRGELIRVWEGPDSDLLTVLLRYYDEFTGEVARHVASEEEVLFPYVRALIRGERPAPIEMESFAHHYPIMDRLGELKKILIKYYPAKVTGSMTGVLLDIYDFQYDVVTHRQVEDMLLCWTTGRLKEGAGGQ